MAEKTVVELTALEIELKHMALFEDLKLEWTISAIKDYFLRFRIMLRDLNNHSEDFIYKLKK